MKVVGDDLRRETEEPLEMLDGGEERAKRMLAGQVAEVLAQDRLAPPDQRDRALQLAAAGQDGLRGLDRQPDAQWDVPARPTHKAWSPSDHAGHRIVARHLYGPVVPEQDVGRAPQAGEGVVVGVRLEAGLGFVKRRRMTPLRKIELS